MRRCIFNILLVALILVSACPARAGDALIAVKYNDSLDFKGIYTFSFIGLTFGKMGVEGHRDADGYAMTADVASVGIINLFTRHTSHTTVTAAGKKFAYSDIDYETHYQTKHKPRHVKLVYRKGVLTEEIAEPPEDPKKRPPVPTALRNASLDPLSFALAMRKELAAALQSGHSHFSLDVYDGRRLTEADFTVIGEKTYHRQPVIQLDVRRKLLAGFTASELADYDPKEPTLHMYFSDDARLIPLRVEAHVFFGTLAATLVKECGAGESCLLGNKD